MSGLGTIVNVAAILGGCVIGLLVKGGLPKHLEDTITSAVGLCVIFVGISGALKGMMTVTAGGLDTRDTLVMVLCMVIGSALGGEGLGHLCGGICEQFPAVLRGGHGHCGRAGGWTDP